MHLGFDLINEDSSIEEFNCGDEELNFYLKHFALLYQQRRFGITMTFFEKNDVHKKVIGYYTVCPASIERNLLSAKFLSGPKPNPIPAFKLCRLAVDKNFQGQQLGRSIFIHALEKIIFQAQQIGGSLVIIDAKHEKAKKFYEKFGFVGLQSNELILVQTIKYLEKQFIK